MVLTTTYNCTKVKKYATCRIILNFQTSYTQIREVSLLKDYIDMRAVELAEYIIENGATVRDAAKQFGISKSTVHKDVGMRLEKINKCLYIQVKSVLDKNKSERHIRGGLATKNKYEKSRIRL